MVFMFSGKWCFYGGGKSAFIGIELERNARYFCAKVSGVVRGFLGGRGFFSSTTRVRPLQPFVKLPVSTSFSQTAQLAT